MDEDLQEKQKWNDLRPRLNKKYTNNGHWKKAIELYEARLNKKFFNPVRTIIKHQELKGEGFAIVTVLCSLIESLASFRKGEIYSFNTVGLPSYYYRQSRDMYVKFLCSDDVFRDIFWSKDSVGKPPPKDLFDANDFYSSVRCGLLHEARTKGNWYINATKKKVKKEKIFIEKRGNKIVILRTIMFHRLEACVANYLTDLQNDDKEFDSLRRFFARKLDHIYGYDHTAKGFEWWDEK